MTSLYVLQELPDTCWIQEAALWVALGTVPGIVYWDGEDRRRSPEYILDNPAGDSPLFKQADFEHLSINIDYERYDNAKYDGDLMGVSEYIAARKTAYSDLETTMARITASHADQAEHLQMNLDEAQMFFGEALAEDERIIAELEWVEEVEAPLNSLVEIARTDVLRALIKGDLAADGWVQKEVDESQGDLDFDDYGGFEPIDKKHWKSDNFDWVNGTLTTRSKAFKHAQVDTNELMRIWPKPAGVPPKTITVERYPGYICLNRDDAEASKVSRSAKGQRSVRGEPSVKALWRQAVRNYIRIKLDKDGMPSLKKELEHDAIDFARVYLEHHLERSTAQDWIKPVVEEYLAKNSGAAQADAGN